MSEPVQIYGNELKLGELEEGEIVTDVVVLSRVVFHNDDGEIQDRIRITRTGNTPGIIMTGMITAANAIDLSAWSN